MYNNINKIYGKEMADKINLAIKSLKCNICIGYGYVFKVKNGKRLKKK